MSIWFRPFTFEALNALTARTLAAEIDIRFSAAGEDWLAATMPVDARTHQPFGILHGGASVALAETVGSVAGTLCVDPERFRCVGQEVNANHVRAVGRGTVTGTDRPLHLGRSSQVWGIDIANEEGQRVCIARLTLAVLPLA